MNLTFKIFGFEIATLDLTIPESEPVTPTTVVEKAVGGMSRWWTKRMFSG